MSRRKEPTKIPASWAATATSQTAAEAKAKAKGKAKAEKITELKDDEPPAAQDEETLPDADSESQASNIMSADDLHRKRKQMLGQLTTGNAGESEEETGFRKRKLEEYKSASRMGKHQIIAEWIKHDGRLKSWYSNVAASRDEAQEWTDHQQEGWMSPKIIAELNKLDVKDEGDKQRLDYLLNQLESRDDPIFGEKFGDKEYYYAHVKEVFDYSNRVTSATKVTTNCDVKGKLVDPHVKNADAKLLLCLPDAKKIKIEDPALEALKKEVGKAKKLEQAGAQARAALQLTRRSLSDEGQELLDGADRNFMKETDELAWEYERAENAIKNGGDYEDFKAKMVAAQMQFQDKLSKLKALKITLLKDYKK